MSITIIKQYKYCLYRSNKRDKYLHHKINIAGLIWNHVLALQKRYYKLTGKSISKSKMQAHIAKLRMGRVRKYKERPAKKYGKKYTFWQELDSQATQEVCDRLYEAWKQFFNKTAGRPRFKKVKKYKSFTLKQSGYKILEDTNIHITGGQNKGNIHKKATGHIEIDGRDYKFIKHRVLEGKIKTVTVKRDTCNQLWVCFVVECELESLKKVTTGKSAGFDFGLKTFLTDSNGKAYKSDEFLKQELDRIRVLHRTLSRKQVGSKRYKRAKYALSRAYIRIADKRTDSHYKLAHQLCKDFDRLYFEDLNIDGMKRLWGRKVSDLAFSEFLEILEWIAFKYDVDVTQIDRWQPTSKVCSHCGAIQDMPLHERVYDCNSCDLKLDRDHNAAKNIKRIGASIPLQEACQTGTCACIVVDGRSPHL